VLTGADTGDRWTSDRPPHDLETSRPGILPVTCGVAPSSEWRLPWERAQPQFRPFTNILLAPSDVSSVPDSSVMETIERRLRVELGPSPT
jgi:hypothetical protein